MNVLCYVPNIIGYFRAACLVVAAIAFDTAPLFHLSYSLNFLLDGVDGFAARYFNQVSRFGYCLDMILDRVGNALLYAKLTHICCKPVWMILMFIDISSHWFMTLSTQEHKKQTNAWIKFYYAHLGLICFGNELFLINLTWNGGNPYLFASSLAPFFFKQCINVMQLGISVNTLANTKNIF